jgi:hypothetical protein
MFGRFFKDETDTPLDKQIDAVLRRMSTLGVDSEDYSVLLSHLERLNTLKVSKRRVRVNPDTWALIAGNILGILVIVAYEQKHVMTSRGFTQLIQPRRPK